MPFGLRNAAQTLQRFIDNILRGLHFCYAYIDDLLVASSTPEEHLQHLRLVFKCLCDYGIIINPQKCHFVKSSLDFLGHHINSSGIAGESPSSPRLPTANLTEEVTTVCWTSERLQQISSSLC